MKRVAIADNKGLIKDLSSGAVINTDNEAYNSALVRKKNKQVLKKLQDDYEELKDRIAKLEQIIFKYK